MPRETNIQIRRGSSTEWTSANPTLSNGEIAIETNTKKLKVGDGSTAWNNLKYVCVDGGDIDIDINISGNGTAAEVPGAPTIGVARYDDIDGDTRVNGSVLNNGANVTSLRFVFSVSGAQTPDELVIFNENGVDEFGAVFEADYGGETVQVFATNSVGEGEGSTPVTVIAA